MLRLKFKETAALAVQACREVYGDSLVTVAVYGSAGRGTPNPYSDLDLLVIAETLPQGRLKRMEQFESVEERLKEHLAALSRRGIHISLSPMIKTPAEVLAGSLVFLDMLDDAVIYIDRDRFFQRYLERLSRRLQNLGAKKIKRGERWHWVLKPDYQEGEVFEI